MKPCWVPIFPDPSSGKYLASPGGRYAALLSVDARASLNAVENELKKQDFHVTYSWQSGQPIRGPSGIDNWLAALPAPTRGTVWMYFELNFVGDAFKSIATHIEKCILFLCGSADLKSVLELQQVADGYHPCFPGDTQAGAGTPLPPPTPGPPPKLVPWVPIAAAGAGIVGAIWYASRRWKRSHGAAVR